MSFHQLMSLLNSSSLLEGLLMSEMTRWSLRLERKLADFQSSGTKRCETA